MSDLLVTATELRDALAAGRFADGGPVRVLDVRWRLDRPDGLPEYRDGHIPGAQYVDLDHEAALAEAARIWDTINGPNLTDNVLPTRSRATLVLRKDRDHSVRYVRLRKL